MVQEGVKLVCWLVIIIWNLLLGLYLAYSYRVMIYGYMRMIHRYLVIHRYVTRYISPEHGEIVQNGVCALCYSNFNSTKHTTSMFKCTQSISGRLCCPKCIEQWIYSQRSEVYGTAHYAKCFNGCGQKMGMTTLQQLLRPKSYDAYCTALTRVYLNQDARVVWCPCGTAFDTVCGRTEVPHWHQCEGCNNFVCLGCGKHSKKNDIDTRRQHKRHKKTCATDNDGIAFKNTRRCPKCTGQISKTYGCNSMRCTLCNTSFDWKERGP
jgi:hypothetical protein